MDHINSCSGIGVAYAEINSRIALLDLIKEHVFPDGNALCLRVDNRLEVVLVRPVEVLPIEFQGFPETFQKCYDYSQTDPVGI